MNNKSLYKLNKILLIIMISTLLNKNNQKIIFNQMLIDNSIDIENYNNKLIL